MMNRREWLARVFGATIAAAVAPLVDLTDATPAFWNQPPITKLLSDRWQIIFPDGTTFSFMGKVVAERLLEDGSVNLTVRPDGEIKAGRSDKRTQGTLVQDDKGRQLPLREIHLPVVEYITLDVTSFHSSHDEYLSGLKRLGDFEMKVDFSKEG